MFTGLVEDIGTITRVTRRQKGWGVAIRCSLPAHEIGQGDSIAVDGVCLTVTGFSGSGFTVDVSPESVQRTTLSSLREGDRVNLERALKLADRLGGHLVTGHVDGTAVIASIARQGNFIQINFTASPNILKYIIEKGSVAVAGISLTVNACSASGFSVMIIPHTFDHTTLGDRTTGDRVNIENDILGKYVEKFLFGGSADSHGITREFLKKFNFT